MQHPRQVLQEKLQAGGCVIPIQFRETRNHNTTETTLTIHNHCITTAQGCNKEQARKRAAKKALLELADAEAFIEQFCTCKQLFE